MELSKDIETYPGFCTKCGSILPLLSMEEFLKCYSCKTVFGPESMCNRIFFLLNIVIKIIQLKTSLLCIHNKLTNM